MNAISMVQKINFVANSMIGKPTLPDLLVATNDGSEFMRVGALDQLDSAFDRYVVRRGQQEMNMVGHDGECVQIEAALPPIAVERLQKKTHVSFDDEQFPAMVCRERHEVRSRRGDDSSRLQGETSAAKSRASLPTLNWHEWNSCPSRLFFLGDVHFGKTAAMILRTKENG